jgi:hypothetical protein
MGIVRLVFALIDWWRLRGRQSPEWAIAESDAGRSPNRRWVRLLPVNRYGWIVASCFVTIAFLYWNYFLNALASAFGGR